MRGKAELAGRTPYAVGEPAAGRIVCGKQMICLILSALILWLLTGCMVDQHPEDARTTAVETVETMLTITDPVEKAAVEKAKSEVRAMDTEPRIVATSPSVAEICDRLELPLVGVCASTISELPKRYADVTTVGTAMSPDMEIVSSLNPDWILSHLVPTDFPRTNWYEMELRVPKNGDFLPARNSLNDKLLANSV